MSLRSVGSMLKPPGDAVEVLAVSPLNIDCIRLRQILSGRNWRLQEVSSCGEASALLDERDFPVVLCERSQTDGNWKDLLDVTATLPTPPSLVVCSRLADESLWAEVLNLGGFDVVLMPFEPDEVLRVTFAAWRKWSEVSLNRPPDKRRIERASEPARKSCQAKWPEAGLPRALNPMVVQRQAEG